MTSDIILKDNEIHMNGWRLVVNGADLIIDAGPTRRGQNLGMRRAVVHGPNDTLVINWSNDYTNGVVVHSALKVRDSLQARVLEADNTVKVGNAVVAQSANNRVVLGDENSPSAIEVQGRGLQINGALHVRGDPVITDHAIRVPDIQIAPPPSSGPQPTPYSLLQRIAQLEARIQALENA